MDKAVQTAERDRLAEAREKGVPWKMWGPYLSERQWGTVREDYSGDGDAWDFFPHDHARSRVYAWGEDGLAGVCDERQRLCLALALWNGRDPILKERLFGLANGEGNHGEDVKECYWYLDCTPTHAYMKLLYKYPHAAYPYDDLVQTNRSRSKAEMEYELVDTGVLDGGRYFDVFVEYAKASPQELLGRVTVFNRGDEAASLHVLPTLWFRNTWSDGGAPAPEVRAVEAPAGMRAMRATHADLGERFLTVEGEVPLLFTHNETNRERLYGQPNATPYVKDAFHACVIERRGDAVNPAATGTKAAARLVLDVAPGQSAVVRFCLSDRAPGPDAFRSFDEVLALRAREADAFYAALIPVHASPDEARVMRQALAGMLWSKQVYRYDVGRWLREHGSHPLEPTSGTASRNREWYHMVADDIICMPDKWEYPWFAAWDLAFHTVALGLVDVDFAKQQLLLLLRESYLHPNGQIPAYEWNFSDVNPPVQAWAALHLYHMEQEQRGEGDLGFLKEVLAKLSMNFTWWVNRKDRSGRGVFEGGFLGLDNIGVFDRSSSLPYGGTLEQADGTAWMALYCQTMMQIAFEIALLHPSSADMAVKFAEHFLWIVNATFGLAGDGMWDEEDGFFYDVLRLPDGQAVRMKVRSIVGLLPLCAATVIPGDTPERLPELVARIRHRIASVPELSAHLSHLGRRGYKGRWLLSMLDEDRLRRVLRRVLDPQEFLGDHGIRGLSKAHEADPYVLWVDGQKLEVAYAPADSPSGMFGGNSNWRGPVWMPINVMIIRALINLYAFYGDDFRIECPTCSGVEMTLFEVAREIAGRLTGTFLADERGRRPVFGGSPLYHEDPHFRDLILFYEYFHGDNGAGLGASHQTGWTGMVANLINMFAGVDPKTMLDEGRVFARHRGD